MVANQNGKHPTTNSADEIIASALGGRLKITFAPPSILARATAWKINNEIRAAYDESEADFLKTAISSVAYVLAHLVDIETKTTKSDTPEIKRFLEWCDTRHKKNNVELFQSLIAMPDAFYDALIDAFDDKPNYVPFEQRPADKLPLEVKQEALDPKANSIAVAGNGS